MSNKEVLILGIESSCDDTSAAVISNQTILSNVIAGQEVHKNYGGVVPELASRAHQQNIVPVVHEALKKADIKAEQLQAIAFTRGPGLLGSLLVGTSFAKGLSMSLDIPLIEVNHMQAHILAHFIEDETNPSPSFPFLCLTVSGGHTQIVLVKNYFDMEVIGKTLDDAAGEAFDKTAKLLQLPYPGGPLIDKLSQEGNPKRFPFPHPKVEGLNFSFSGFKTAVLYFLQKETKANPNFIEENKADIAASIQKTIIDILLSKLSKAVKQTGIQQIAIAGGVSANSGLRAALQNKQQEKNWNIYIPKFEYCTDNAAMIAITGYYKYLQDNFTTQDTTPSARLTF